MNDSGMLPLADEQLRDTIAMFEQILEVMPDDEMALRTLYDAYMHVGKRPEAFDMLRRLSAVVLDAHADDHDMLGFLLDQFARHEVLVDEQTEPLLKELKRRFNPEGEPEESAAPQEAVGVPQVREVKTSTDDRKEAEMALAWRLLQDKIVNQETYDQALQDLTAMAARNVETPVTVLHVLSDRSYTHFSSVITYIAKNSGAPFLSLASFDVSSDLYTLLPYEFVCHHAAIVFKMIGNELLLATLNPFDAKLKKTVEHMTGRVCHTFLVTPEDYDALLEKFRKKRSDEKG